ncbi:MAG: hypothetical protein ABIK09_04265 [Pseudomonadota bacterium]
MPWTLFLAVLLLVAPDDGDPPAARTLIDQTLAPQPIDAPGFPYRAKDLVSCTGNKVRLKRVSTKKNQITDDEEWYASNDLIRPGGTMDPGWDQVPQETRWGRIAFFRDNGAGRYVGIYIQVGQRIGAKDEAGFSSIYDKEFDYTAVVFDAQRVPRAVYPLTAFHPGILEMSHAALVGDVLYFDANYNGYASIAKKKTGYLTALDLADGRVLWTTKNLTASFWGFIVHGDVIVAGYGFTAEPDFLYVIDRRCGKILQTERIKTAHDVLIPRGDRLYVRTYDHDYVFDFVETAR